MANWHVIVDTIRTRSDDELFVIFLFDPAGPDIRGPDGGEMHVGYKEDEVRRILVERYGLTELASQGLVEREKN